jgi:hypothetical protein
MTPTLSHLQRRFPPLVAQLIRFAYAHGYELTLGDAYRHPDWQATLVTAGRSRVHTSLHTDRLAIDLNLFRDSLYETTTEAHAPLGAFWESLDPLARWGGRFGDGNHYSLTFGGRR